MTENDDVVTQAADHRRIQSFEWESWTITDVHSRILESVCRSPSVCSIEKAALAVVKADGSERCQFCSITESLRRLPQWPEMFFAENSLTLKHSSGLEFSFNALDALKRVKLEEDSVKVSMTEAWKAARSDCEYIESKVTQPYDWTFTTDYKGTMDSTTAAKFRPASELARDERINYNKLREREKILFYSEMDLYEDELGDNGASAFMIKIRVMPSCLFLLARFYLRVDHVLIRIHDSRYFIEKGSSKLIREFSRRESKISDLKVPPELLIDRNAIADKLKLLEEKIEVLDLNSS